MAEAHDSRSAWKSEVLCRYFVHGACRAGENCHYSHCLEDRPQMVCRYYLKNSCAYGENCRYDHIRPSRMPSQQDVSCTPKSKPNDRSDVKCPLTNKPSPASLNTTDRQTRGFHMVKLQKPGSADKEPLKNGKTAEEWVQAAEFIPGQKWKGADSGPLSYVEAASSGLSTVDAPSYSTASDSLDTNTVTECTTSELCPYAAASGLCHFGDRCKYIHGDICDICFKAVLHPTNEDQRQQHKKECEKNLEEDMELSFAVQRSKDKCCGICMEVVWEKNPVSERRFGILSKCKHVFCLSCIRRWRAAKQFEHKIVRACPECRVKSDFITPSAYWVEDDEEKEKLIQGYKTALSQKHCKYFDRGRGECPFNENCFYLHAHPDGRKASPKPMRHRKREDADGKIDIVRQIILWSFLEEWDASHSGADFGDLDVEEIFQLNFADSSDESDDDFEFFSY